MDAPKKSISKVPIMESPEEFETPSKSKKRSMTKKYQRKRKSSESDEDKIDKRTEENIQQAALKNNLTDDAVKKILKTVVSNDHVLAIVKLKEEEMERNDQSHKALVDSDVEEEHDIEQTPKITRAKAKVLNKRILPITSPMEPSEASILIQQEFESDDEDEEYEPGNDDIHSDDDPNSSISDMDSQPSTPKKLNTAHDDTSTKYTNDGLFKIPKDRKDCSKPCNNHDYIIAQQTRSKVSLTTTSIETIESTFQPPDISPDMYDRDNEMDTDWIEFLNVLTKPINHTFEDDDETDPEYIAADQIPIDKEELREVNISKKELNDLVDELFSNLSDVDFDEINKYDIIPELFRTKQKTSRNETLNEINKSDEEFKDEIIESSQVSTLISYKQQKSTPTTPHTASNIADDSIISTLSTSTLSHLNLSDSINQTPIVVPINVVNPLEGAFVVNGIIQLPQYQKVLVQIPTIDILKVQTQQIQQQQQSDSTTEEKILSQLERSTDSIGIHESAYRNTRYRHHLFHRLKIDLPFTVKFDEGHRGFTNHQLDILNQQLRMHVQFSTQNFLQVYGHPGKNLWKCAINFKSFLTEINEATKDTCIKIDNLEPSLSLINKWEEDLSTSTTENTEYLEFLLGEWNKSQHAIQTKRSYIPKFNERVMNAIVESYAFPYPNLLPNIPFRMDVRKSSMSSTFLPIEDFLIAFFLEKFYDEHSDQRKSSKCQSSSNVSLLQICEKICLQMCPLRYSTSKRAVYRHVISRKAKTATYNPIQYYFEHRKAPPFQHNLINVMKKCTPMNHNISALPDVWAKYVKKRQANNQVKNQSVQIYTGKPIQIVSPRVRTTTVVNKIEDSRIAYYSPEKDNGVILPAQTRPVFTVKPINSSQNSVPIQYEIVQINSIPQTAEFSEASVDFEHTGSYRVIDREESLNISNVNDSKSVTGNQLKPSHIDEQAKTHQKSCLSEFNPNKSTYQQVNTIYVKNKQWTCLFENFWSCNRKICKKYLRINRDARAERYRKLCRVVQSFKVGYYISNDQFSQNEYLLAVYNSIQILNAYVCFLVDNFIMASNVKRTNKDGADDLNRRSKTVDAIAGDPQEINNTSTTTAVNVTKKNPKAQRSDNTRLMLLPESKEDVNEKDLVYAQNFMDKVEETYQTENPEKITEFHEILKNFNQLTDKVEELYNKMEKLFTPDHPELAELFLTFLLPGQAAQVGKFMEHFMITNMNNFINKLHIFFNKQPAQIRKIMTCLRELSNENDLKWDQMKSKVLPLLKGNPLLIDWFKQCFPSETTSDCPADEYESLSLYKVENIHPADDENDVHENVSHTEIVADPVENPCHIRYLNGRVYYGSRILLPAKLSFLVVTASDQKSINEAARNESGILKHTSDLETDYRCVHSLKQYGDNKMKECQKSQLETADNNTNDDVDAERSTDDLNCSDAVKKSFIGDLIPEAEAVASETCVQADEKQLCGSNDLPESVYNTCDDLTLKAHGIRLNSTVHQSNVIKSEDLLCLLEPVDDVAHKLTDESLKHSPKKQSTRLQRKAPISKKSKKPVNNRKAAAASTISSHDSNAIRTAKRLKRLIESNEVDEPNKLPKKPKISKCTKVNDGSETRRRKHYSNEEFLSTFNVKVETKTTAESPSSSNVTNTWSRDEDKVVLEQIKMGFTNEENLVKTLHEEKLPNRSYSEIYDRFKFLMDVIANL